MLVIALADMRVSMRVQLVVAVAGVIVVLILGGAIVARGGAAGLSWRPFDPGQAPTGHGLALAVILAFTGFIGFEAAAVLGEEAARPRRVIPRAILGTVIVATIYFVFAAWTQAVGFGVAGAGRSGPPTPTALDTLATRYVGHWFATLVDIIVVIDAFVAALAGVNLTAGRCSRWAATAACRGCSPPPPAGSAARTPASWPRWR